MPGTVCTYRAHIERHLVTAKSPRWQNRALGDVRISHIGVQDIEELRDLLGNKLSPSTRRVVTGTCSAIFGYSKHAGHIATNPFDDVEPLYEEKREITDDAEEIDDDSRAVDPSEVLTTNEMRAVLAAARPRAPAHDTGLRSDDRNAPARISVPTLARC
jgi:hypothetical protein